MARDPEHAAPPGAVPPGAVPTRDPASPTPAAHADLAQPEPDWAHAVWDVLVVGAGPAGSSAARAAADAGASVLLLDRSPFPRYKTCGGGLLGESLRLIPAGARATIESRVADSLVTSRFGRPFRLRRPDPYLAMVRRIEFDQALVEAAQDAGARFVDGVAVREITQPGAATEAAGDARTTANAGRIRTDDPAPDAGDDAAAAGSADDPDRDRDRDAEPATHRGGAGHRDHGADGVAGEGDASESLVSVRTTAGTVRARVVIGADGSSGRVGRHVGVTPGGVDLGLEDEVAMPADGTRWRDTVYLDWGGASGSYAWVFPKGESLTVGVIQRKGAPDATRDYLAAWRAHLGLAGSETLHSSGHLTQWRTDTSPLRRDRVIVAGDAAGLLEPWTREGISFALRSGAWAGEAAAVAAARDAAAPGRAGKVAGATAARHTAAAAFAESDAAGASRAWPRSFGDGDPLDGVGDPLAAYTARVDAELGAEMRAGGAILAAFERHRGLVHTLLRTRRGARYFVRFCRGETSLARFARHRWAMRIVRALG